MQIINNTLFFTSTVEIEMFKKRVTVNPQKLLYQSEVHSRQNNKFTHTTKGSNPSNGSLMCVLDNQLLTI